MISVPFQLMKSCNTDDSIGGEELSLRERKSIKRELRRDRFATYGVKAEFSSRDGNKLNRFYGFKLPEDPVIPFKTDVSIPSSS